MTQRCYPKASLSKGRRLWRRPKVKFQIASDYADKSRSKLGSQPDTIPEPPKAPNSGRQLLAKEGHPSVWMTSVTLEVSDSLLEALRGASMDEEHRALMSAVIQKVSSTKSGLTEACTSLLTGFEVSSKNV